MNETLIDKRQLSERDICSKFITPAVAAAGWDALLPAWFSRLHPRYRTPANSIIFVGMVALVFAIGGQLGAGAQEAFQLVDNAANVFYGVAYAIMFALPLVGAQAVRASAPIWLRVAAICGLCVSLFAVVFTIYPIIDVPSRFVFAAKIIATAVVCNGLGALIFVLGRKRAADR